MNSPRLSNANSLTQPIHSRPWNRPTTFDKARLGPVGVSQNLPSTRTNPAAQPHTMTSSLKVSRPHSIAELAEAARQSLGDNIASFDFETVERMVEKARRDAENFRKQGELESAFIELTRAVAIVSNKIPSHPGMVLQVPTGEMEGRYHNLSLVSSTGEL